MKVNKNLLLCGIFNDSMKSFRNSLKESDLNQRDRKIIVCVGIVIFHYLLVENMNTAVEIVQQYLSSFQNVQKSHVQ